MLDLPSEVIRTLITTVITTLGGIAGAYIIYTITKGRGGTQRQNSGHFVGAGALTGLLIGIVVGITLAIFWPTGDPCLRAKISAPQGTKNNVHAAAYQVEYKIPISWTPPSGERCVMVVQSYQKANPVPVREYKAIVSGTILDIGDPGSGETQIKIWVDGSSTAADDTWVWVK
jgi:hypothetical protein